MRQILIFGWLVLIGGLLLAQLLIAQKTIALRQVVEQLAARNSALQVDNQHLLQEVQLLSRIDLLRAAVNEVQAQNMPELLIATPLPERIITWQQMLKSGPPTLQNPFWQQISGALPLSAPVYSPATTQAGPFYQSLPRQFNKPWSDD